MSTLKVRVTQPGVNTNAGEVAIGTTFEVEGAGVNGDELPGFLVNKAVIVGDDDNRDLTADNAELAGLKKHVEMLDGRIESAKVAVDSLTSERDTLRTENDSLVLQLQTATDEIAGLRDTLRDDAAFEEMELRESFKELAGKDSDKRWGLVKLREEVATLKAKA